MYDDIDMYDIDGDGNLDSDEQCWYEEDLYGSEDDSGYRSGSKYGSSRSTSNNSRGYVQPDQRAGVGEVILSLIIWSIIAFLFVGGLIVAVAFPPAGAFMIYLGVRLKEAVF